MLQARGLSVEIGGRLVVESANFTVMPRDKVGLVGRNGAGKTTLFRVLGGEREPFAGTVVRKGGFGYLPQDPRIAGVLDGRTAVSHILSGRGIDVEMERIEKLRIAMEERPDERNVARYTRAEEIFRTNGGYSAESEARAAKQGIWARPGHVLSASDGAVLRQRLGHHILAEGKVVSARSFRGRVYLNFARYWKTGLSLIIAEKQWPMFSGNVAAEEIVGKRLRARGWLDWRGGPVIVAGPDERIELAE